MLQKELGEPTLCMRSESPQSTGSSSSTTMDSSSKNPMPKILLKTKILLEQVYNRQGDNIITWSEPSFDSLEASDANMSSEMDGVSSLFFPFYIAMKRVLFI